MGISPELEGGWPFVYSFIGLFGHRFFRHVWLFRTFWLLIFFIFIFISFLMLSAASRSLYFSLENISLLF